MATLSGLAIGLSFLFGCVLLGLVAELYYLLWWKKRLTNGRREKIEQQDYDNTNNTPVFSYLSCWEKPNSVNIAKTPIPSDANGGGHEQEEDVELGLGLGKDKDLILKGYGEDSVEVELMRLHNLCGPPRFLFTINEETKEDLESEDGGGKSTRSRKGSRTKSLSDLFGTLDTPFLTPLPSPPLKSQALDSYNYYNHGGFNPLFESSTDAEINKLRASPPPTFKFLRDAEEKLLKRLVDEAEKRANKSFQDDPVVKNHKTPSPAAISPTPTNDKLKEEEGSFVRLIVGKKDGIFDHQVPQYHHPSTQSQVLPLASSPSAVRTFHNKKSSVQ